MLWLTKLNQFTKLKQVGENMTKEEYKLEKARISYELRKQNKFFRKARAIVLKNNKLLAIKVVFKESGNIHYLFPGGGVDEGETIKQASVRETLEEFSVIVKAKKYLGKHYYKVPQTYKGETFISNRIDYYYICEYINDATSKEFGVEGEFNRPDRTYEKVELTVNEVKKITPEQLNNIDNRNHKKLIEYMEEKN